MSAAHAAGLWVSWPGEDIKDMQIQTETLQSVTFLNSLSVIVPGLLCSGVMERNTRLTPGTLFGKVAIEEDEE